MDFSKHLKATPREIVAFADGLGHDLKPSLYHDIAFSSETQFISFWNKTAAFPGTGRPEEIEGTIKYSLQEQVRSHPADLREASHPVRGMWSDFVTVADIAYYHYIFIAIMIEAAEVDELPRRRVTQRGIG